MIWVPIFLLVGFIFGCYVVASDPENFRQDERYTLILFCTLLGPVILVFYLPYLGFQFVADGVIRLMRNVMGKQNENKV